MPPLDDAQEGGVPQQKDNTQPPGTIQPQANLFKNSAEFGTLEAAGQVPVDRPLAALNTAFAGDGVTIRVTGKPSRPISLVYTHEDEGSDVFLHHVVRVESGAEATY